MFGCIQPNIKKNKSILFPINLDFKKKNQNEPDIFLPRIISS